MTPQVIAERLLAQYEQPDFERLVEELRPHLTVDVIAQLKKRVDEEKLKDVHLALRIATLAQSLVPYISNAKAEALAYWAKGTALIHLSRYQEALVCCQSAATIYAAQNELLALVGVQAPMVAVLRNLGKHQDALGVAEEVEATCLILGTPARHYLALLKMNVGSIYRQLGDPEAALETYQQGRDLFVKLGDEINVARIDINRANVLQVMSRFVAAQKLLQSARRTLLVAGHAQQVARVDANLGLLAHFCGRYQEALSYFEAARRGFIGMETLIAMVDLRRCLSYRKLNLIAETITQASTAERIFAQNGMLYEQARALYLQGMGYQLSGAFALAERYLKKSRQLSQQQNLRPIVFERDYDLARLAYITGRIDDARQLALRLQEEVIPETWPKLAAQTRLLLAQCALIGQPEHVRQYAQAALDLSVKYSLRETTIEAHHLLGQILERTSPSDAWLHYKTAMQQIESLRTLLLVDQFRLGFMDDKLPIYADAVRFSQQMGTPAQLLYTLNLAHSAPLFQLPAPEPTAFPNDDLHRELGLLREKWHWYQNKLEEASHEMTMSMKELRSQLAQVEAELADLIHRWKVYETSMGQQRQGQLFRFDAAEQFLTDIQHRLQPNDVLLHYYLVNDSFQALLVTPDAIHIFPDLASTKSLGRSLRGWNRQLTHIGLITQSPETSKSLAQRYLARFHEALVTPLISHLVPESHLFVIMPPGWHDLPLAAFFDGECYLVQRHQITYLSAPEVLRGTMVRPLDDQINKQALIIGHSDGKRLSGTVRATQTIAEQLLASWQTTLLMDADATFDNFQAASRNSQLIHLSTHATYRTDNPLFSWARLAEHRLTVADLYEMKLPQKPLVVLSACETGRGQARGGGLLGMGRALLAAGASGLVVTLWRVEDQATAQLMVDFYSDLSSKQKITNEASAALRHAQQQAIAQQLHPFFWAGFIFIQG